MTNYLITGANRGIGLALATLLAERGDTVIATARDPKAASELLTLADRFPDRITLLPLDVTHDASVATLAHALHGRSIDVLVNNAGIIGPDRQSTLDTDFPGFLETLDTNTLGPLRVTQAILPLLKKSGAPRIVTVSSMMGSLSSKQSDKIAYRTSKAAVNKVMQGLGTDLRKDGIATLTLHPGWVRTDMGGSGADIDVSESADGIVKLIDTLTISNSGRFMNYDGTERAW